VGRRSRDDLLRSAGRQAAALFASAVLAAACGGGGSGPGAPPAPVGCTDSDQKQFVLDVMQDIYFWVDELPANVSPDDFATAQELLDALRFEPLDRYSGIADAATESAFFSDSQFIGVGIGLSTVESRVFVTQVFGDGPAAATPIARGDELIRINGQAVADALAGDGLSAAFGPNDIGVLVELRVRDRNGLDADYVLLKDLVTIEPVPALELLTVDGRQVGYLAFRDFVDPAFAALDDAFATLAGAGVRELVLDLRYNGGGLLSVSEYLGDLLAGGFAGEVFYSRRHNTANTRFDDTTRFLARRNALALERLVVITTAGTASASELVINGLTPWMDVTLVGGTTFGKPIGQYGYEFCEQVLRPASFTLVNALDVGDYYDGFTPDCAAEDDFSRALGDPDEAMLAEALAVLRTGTCTNPFAVAAAPSASGGKRPAGVPRPAVPVRGEMGSVW
jgi:C-terminal processing protease CtpA/Prc